VKHTIFGKCLILKIEKGIGTRTHVGCVWLIIRIQRR